MDEISKCFVMIFHLVFIATILLGVGLWLGYSRCGWNEFPAEGEFHKVAFLSLSTLSHFGTLWCSTCNLLLCAGISSWRSWCSFPHGWTTGTFGLTSREETCWFPLCSLWFCSFRVNPQNVSEGANIMLFPSRCTGGKGEASKLDHGREKEEWFRSGWVMIF